MTGTAGCGKRGDPLPPLLRIPAPVSRPRVSQQGPVIVIEWRAPVKTTDGGELELQGAEVLRRVVDPAPPAAPTQVPTEETAAPTVPDRPAEAAASADSQPPGSIPAEGAVEEVRSEETPELPEATQPREGESGTPGTDLARLTLAVTRQAGFASEAKVVARLECREPGQRLVYRDAWDPAWEGKRVEYAVRHLNGSDRRSENSDPSSIDPLAPLPAPSALEVAAADGFVRMAWKGEPEPVGLDELEFGFNVYRKRAREESYPAAALNRGPLQTTSFEDRDVEFRREWCYVVRRVAARRPPEIAEPTPEVPNQGSEPASGSPTAPTDVGVSEAQASTAPRRAAAQRPATPALIESESTEEVCLTPTDTFAPPTPTGVVALRVSAGILLSWSESDAQDLRGYRVYRAERGEGPFEPLGSDLLDLPSFTDRGLTPGKTYFYQVSAVDAAEPSNESPLSPPVAAQAPQ